MAALDELSRLIAGGLPDGRELLAAETRAAVDRIFGEQFRATSPRSLRVALMSPERNVPFAGLVHPDNPDSGVYGGTSLVWFPIPADDAGPAETLLTLVCGTRGLSPDELILSRPGHRRQLQAMARGLSRETGTQTWVKRDPTHLGAPVPEAIASQYPRCRGVFERYGAYIYALCRVPTDPSRSRQIVSRFLHFYGLERGWVVLNAARPERDRLLGTIESNVFSRFSPDEIDHLIRERRFVILQGPPGTGKSRLAAHLIRSTFGGRGRVVQFHPGVTYETFVAGIAPDVAEAALRFRVKRGWLIEANSEAADGEFLFVIDEINRADLGRVLGEAVYLFEAGEIASAVPRAVTLPQPLHDGAASLSLSPNLYVIGTMNTADRSIAPLDLAIRRRFAFVDVWPDIDVVRNNSVPAAAEMFARLQQIFVEFADDSDLNLLPGHAYFLATDEAALNRRMRFELIPLLREYLSDGRVQAFAGEIAAYVDWLEGAITTDGEAIRES